MLKIMPFAQHVPTVDLNSAVVTDLPTVQVRLDPDRLAAIPLFPGEEHLRGYILTGFQAIDSAGEMLHRPIEYQNHLRAAKNMAALIKPSQKLRLTFQKKVSNSSVPEIYSTMMERIHATESAHKSFVRSRSKTLSAYHERNVIQRFSDTAKRIFQGRIRSIHLHSSSSRETAQAISAKPKSWLGSLKASVQLRAHSILPSLRRTVGQESGNDSIAITSHEQKDRALHLPHPSTALYTQSTMTKTRLRINRKPVRQQIYTLNAMQIEIKANIYKFLALKDIAKICLLNRAFAAEHPEVVSLLGSQNDQLGSIALHKTRMPETNTNQSTLHLSPKNHIDFMQFISALRDESIYAKCYQDAKENLHRPEFFYICLDRAFGNKRILHMLIEAWPLLPTDARPAAKLELTKGIGSDTAMQSAFLNEENAFVRIHATNESAQALCDLYCSADPPLRIDEKIALVKHTNSDEMIFNWIASGATDPELRIRLLRDTRLTGLSYWILSGSPMNLDERLAIMLRSEVHVAQLTRFAKKASDSSEKFAIAEQANADISVFKLLLKNATPGEHRKLLEIYYRRFPAAQQ